jgi:hypothetical protein
VPADQVGEKGTTVSADYQAVQKTLAGGGDPAMLCATCPWDRNCFTPPTMTSAEVEQQIAEAGRKDELKATAALAEGRAPSLPAGTLLTALIYAGKDTSAQVCPVFGLRLRSSGGRKIADTFKALMQEWDDQK